MGPISLPAQHSPAPRSPIICSSMSRCQHGLRLRRPVVFLDTNECGGRRRVEEGMRACFDGLEHPLEASGPAMHPLPPPPPPAPAPAPARAPSRLPLLLSFTVKGRHPPRAISSIVSPPSSPFSRSLNCWIDMPLTCWSLTETIRSPALSTSSSSSLSSSKPTILKFPSSSNSILRPLASCPGKEESPPACLPHRGVKRERKAALACAFFTAFSAAMGSTSFAVSIRLLEREYPPSSPASRCSCTRKIFESAPWPS
mmetsp:Transcript_24239/g.54508  ORF Transcript_24239/g.54508 Transcript_24239/m.54508 type:complete len:256 (-) Transcript_24239:2368-3135(-)